MASYLFLDSSHRNRNEYPNPCDFKVPFGAKTVDEDILDPILEGLPFYSGTVDVGSTLRTVVLSVGASVLDNIYNDMYIKLTSGIGNNMYRKIINYIGATRTATIYPIWSDPIAGGPSAGTTCSIFRGIDNYSPLVYSGAQTSSETYYRIKLLNIIMPNDSLLHRISNLYVHLSTESTKTSRLIYTNNPYINSATFIVPVGDNRHNLSFMILTDCNIIQHIRFKLDDTIVFRVFLESGETLEFPDSLAPDPPNPLVQVTAIFSLVELPARPPQFFPLSEE